MLECIVCLLLFGECNINENWILHIKVLSKKDCESTLEFTVDF